MDTNGPLCSTENITLHTTEGNLKAPINSDIVAETEISVADTTISVIDTAIEHPIEARHVHIPYILNGELYEIQTQEGENVTVKCCNCPADRVYRGSVRSTGNFHMHIKRRHPDLLSKLHDMKVNALLERRDRFVRNRKSTRRRSSANGITRNRLQSTVHPTNALLYTHKLKIKAAYQRHQLQQQQLKQNQEHHDQKCSEGMHNWGQGDAYVIPHIERAHDTLLLPEQNEQPLNCSTKHYSSLEFEHSKTFDVKTGVEAQRTSQENCSDKNNNNGSFRSKFSTEQRRSSNLLLEEQQNQHNSIYANSNAQSIYDRTTLTAITPCTSSASSYTGSHLNRSGYSLSYEKFGIIKHELYMPQQPIDLSRQPSSEMSESSGFGSAVHANQSSRSNFENTETDNSKYDQLLQHLTNSLQNIQRELQTYNQLSNNRLRLEIAKFEYLHSDFKFQY